MRMLDQAGRTDNEYGIILTGKTGKGGQAVANIIVAISQQNGTRPGAVASGRRGIRPHNSAIKRQATQLVRQTVNPFGQAENEDIQRASHASPCRLDC